MEAGRRRHIGDAIRTVISGGWAAHDPDILADLVEQGRTVARLVLEDRGASEASHDAAERFLAEVDAEMGSENPKGDPASA